jgi:hypothetical protein
MGRRLARAPPGQLPREKDWQTAWNVRQAAAAQPARPVTMADDEIVLQIPSCRGPDGKDEIVRPKRQPRQMNGGGRGAAPPSRVPGSLPQRETSKHPESAPYHASSRPPRRDGGSMMAGPPCFEITVCSKVEGAPGSSRGQHVLALPRAPPRSFGLTRRRQRARARQRERNVRPIHDIPW